MWYFFSFGMTHHSYDCRSSVSLILRTTQILLLNLKLSCASYINSYSPFNYHLWKMIASAINGAAQSPLLSMAIPSITPSFNHHPAIAGRRASKYIHWYQQPGSFSFCWLLLILREQDVALQPHTITTQSSHIVTTHSLHTRSPHTVITHGHRTRSPNTVTTHSHHTVTPHSHHTVTTHSHHTVTTYSHHKRLPHRVTTNNHHTQSPHSFHSHHIVTI